jgi:pyruvate kinase
LGYTRIDGKRTKIVATIGPRSRDEATIRELIRKGMDVARINFSHGTHEAHGEAIDTIRRVAAEENAVVAVMCDLQGPKIRIGRVLNEPLMLKPGDTITLTLDEPEGDDPYTIALPHPEFVKDIQPGMQLLLDDGNLEFEVRDADARSLTTEVIIGGALTSRKGVSAPNARLSLSAITDKDRADVEFALSKQTDYLAMSFVRNADDIRELRWLIRHLGGETAIIAKIEKREAIDAIEAIVAAADGVMVARGDLGVETPAEEVPVHQKRIIQLCNTASKPVITATQMLSSMVDSPRPTRAEASDVFNAIVDGTDAVMLSNETAAGSYPVEAVATMTNIALIAEKHLPIRRTERTLARSTSAEGREIVSDAISQATTQIAESLNCRAIVTATLTGYTARRVAKERPDTPILCVTPSEVTYRRMALVWGVIPIMIPHFTTIDELIKLIVQTATKSKLLKRGDTLIIIAGVPFGIGGQTNFLKIHMVGESSEFY